MTNKKSKSWIKNDEIFSHIKEGEIIFLSNSISSDSYLLGNDHFALFWESFNSPYDAIELEKAFSKEILNLLIEHELITATDKNGTSIPKLPYVKMQLSLKPFPTTSIQEIYSYASGNSGSDY